MNNIRNILKRIGSGMPSGGGSALVVLATLGFGAYGLSKSVITIQPGHVGIIYNRIGGLQDKMVLRDGINLVIPWFQRVIVYDIRTRPQLVNTQSGSKDLQMVDCLLPVLSY
jgi:prohibitin 2